MYVIIVEYMVKIIVTTRSATMGTTLEARDFVACSSPMAATLRNGTTN